MLTYTLHRPPTARRGFTLAEVLVTASILGIVGLAVTKLMMSENRFSDQQNALRSARAVARQGLGVMLSDMRMVQDSGGIDSASVDGKTIRLIAPYLFGLNCGVAGVGGGKTVVSMAPADSVIYAQAQYAGFAWRNGVGRYTIVLPTSPQSTDAPAASATPAQCTGNAAGQAQIRTLSINGRTGLVLDITPAQTTPKQGAAIFFFQRITYSFANSTAYPGQQGLWRTVQGGNAEELVAPFDTSARFRFWTPQPLGDSSVIVPPVLSNIRGVDVVYSGKSTYTPMGKLSPTGTQLVTSIFFKNLRAY